MNAISTLIFDFGGVIINLKTETDWMQQDLFPNYHTESLIKLSASGFFNKWEEGKISAEEFLQQMQSIAIDKEITHEIIKQHWNAILKDIPVHRVELLKQLKQQYRLILLSNTNTIHVEAFEQYIIETFGENILQTNFQTVYYSQEIGMRKPNREIYEFVLEQQGIHASEVIFFDDKEENLTEPKKSRWKTVLVDRDITELTPTVLKDL